MDVGVHLSDVVASKVLSPVSDKFPIKKRKFQFIKGPFFAGVLGAGHTHSREYLIRQKSVVQDVAHFLRTEISK